MNGCCLAATNVRQTSGGMPIKVFKLVELDSLSIYAQPVRSVAGSYFHSS